MSILKQVHLDSVNRRADGSVSMKFTTDLEQSSEELMLMDKERQTRGVIYYSQKGALTQQEVDELDNVDIEIEGKSKSQRLRAVLFVWWKQQGEQGDFKDFYATHMEKLIQFVKDKLEDDKN